MSRIVITIKPNSTKGPLVVPQLDGSLVVYIREIPEGGKVNDALIKLLAKYLGVSKSSLVIVRGVTSRHKVIELNP